ncbi:hypothetical protein [Ketogulonicigenium vulgare]|uniref:hypothetical protein n=1 Tax=Ketogulonicigenium vulgare TaxID=92945 RepID=UPI0023594F96|nr:hypothetical protein [Ketogulonicigenium vulgare]
MAAQIIAQSIVWARIVLGWGGVWLISRGAPPEFVHAATQDPAVIDAVARLIGAALMGLQLVWWQIARRMGWAT